MLPYKGMEGRVVRAEIGLDYRNEMQYRIGTVILAYPEYCKVSILLSEGPDPFRQTITVGYHALELVPGNDIPDCLR